MASVLEAGEEKWQGAFDRLHARFPAISSKRVVQALRENNGHAGYAARELRDLPNRCVKEADLDEKEQVATILSSPPMFKHACKEHFRKFDINRDSTLEWDEISALTGSLYESFGLEKPSDELLHAFFVIGDKNHDGSLSREEFQVFFETFLRYAFFETDKLQKIVKDVSKPSPSPSPKRADVKDLSKPSPAPSPKRGDVKDVLKLAPSPSPSPKRGGVKAVSKLAPSPSPSPKWGGMKDVSKLAPSPSPSPKRGGA